MKKCINNLDQNSSDTSNESDEIHINCSVCDTQVYKNWGSRCEICHKFVCDNNCGIVCDKCEITVCNGQCLAITGCQTTWGECVNCFDYKCNECGNEISRKYRYLSDMKEYTPLCDMCYHHKCSQCEKNMTREDVEKANFPDICVDCQTNDTDSD